jgi:protein-tyrosine kinase
MNPKDFPSPTDPDNLLSVESGEQSLHDKLIGQIMQEVNGLTAGQVQAVVEHQRKTGLRFGEAAVALKTVTDADVLFALSQQFHYPYAPVDRQNLNPELVTAANPFSKQSEAFRAIRRQVLQRAFTEGEPKRALSIISANTGDGKTFFAANLAVVLSQLGSRTLLIDADMRGPRQHEVFGLENSHGLSSVLSGRSGQNMIRKVPDFPSLYLLNGGPTPPNPMELVERPAFGMMLRELVGKFDYVLVDTPAAAHGADCTAVAQKCGAALCLARNGKSKADGLQDLVSTISAGSVKIAGVILNEF